MGEAQHELLGAYAVDALQGAERDAYEAHLADCAACRDELAGLRETLAEFGSGFEQQPPSGLRASVLDAVAADSAASRAGAEPERDGVEAAGQDSEAQGEPTPPNTDDPALPDTEPPSVVTPLPTRGDRRGSRWGMLAAAAIAILALIGVTVWQPWNPRPTTITATDVLQAPDAVRATEPMPGGGSVTLVRSNTVGRAVLITEAMPAAPSGQVHQAWLMRPDRTLVSGGMMAASPNQTMLLEGDARNIVGGGVSLEPPGGSQQPTEVIVQIAL